MTEIVATGTVKAGQVWLDNKQSFVADLTKLTDGSVLVRVERVKPHRSAQQNKYWHGVVVKLFAEHCGYDHDEMHEILKAELLPQTKLIHDRKTGEVLREVKTYGSTATLAAAEFNDLIERAQRLGAEMSIYIPDPNEAVA